MDAAIRKANAIHVHSVHAQSPCHECPVMHAHEMYAYALHSKFFFITNKYMQYNY